jgi:hypothetical protein
MQYKIMLLLCIVHLTSFTPSSEKIPSFVII